LADGATPRDHRVPTKEFVLPESRHKYLYERLGDHDFQLLVNALLAERFPDYVPLPLRQAEGGRDGIQRSPSSYLVYQMKWSAHTSERNPVAWLDAAVRNEEANIRKMVAQGATKYFLVTNVASTGKPGVGTFDRLDAKLREHGKKLGLDMACLWRESVDAMVDSAPDATKWAYADMLAGWDLIRYLIDEQAESRRGSGLRELLRKVSAAQWDEDERVKFSQVDIDRERVADLFVDPAADRIRMPTKTGLENSVTPIGGAALYLLRASLPFTLVRGAPGQGKSTLSQYVCQAHRAAFLPASSRNIQLPDVKEPRFPLRFDVGSYAAWLCGVDVFDPAGDSTRAGGKKRAASESTIECFLAELMTHSSGGIAVTPQNVQDLFERVPALVVIDGLDEAGSPSSRRSIVSAIDQFCGRGKSYTVAPKIVVTTRPSAGELPEPSTEIFEVLVLNQLEQEQQDEYLRKWCAVRDIRGSEGRALRTSFKQKRAEPYIGELAGNPMQLTILLELLHQQGAATPTQRTELYDAYMNLLLAREANKHPDSVRKHRNDLMEIIPFLGWYLQSRSEERGLAGRMHTDELGAAMRHFQRTYEKSESVVDDLFEAATDRLWALTSKEEGVFEFEVVSLREYFAARFLYNYAGEGDRNFDRTTVFRELIRRTYWLNTARFYSGNARGSDLYILAAGIRDELATGNSKQAQVASWTLLTDGVFRSRPTEAASVLEALTTDSGAPLLLEALAKREISPLPQLPSAVSTSPTWIRITGEVVASPGDAMNPARVRVLRELLSQRTEFAQWWADHAQASIHTATEQTWLDLAADCEAANGLVVDLEGVNLAGNGAQRVLNTGLVPPSGSKLEHDLIQAVLDGQCPDTTSVRSLPAQIAVALAPSAFVTSSDSGFNDQSERDQRRRHEAVTLLRRASSPYADVASRRRFRQGEKGSTFPWANTASALFDHVGRCWLASEIAIIGAASKHLSGQTIRPGTTAFGAASHPATLMSQIRIHADTVDWWDAERPPVGDDLARAEWSLALWSIGSARVVIALSEKWEETLGLLTPSRYRAVWLATQHLRICEYLPLQRATVTAQTKRGLEMVADSSSPGPRPLVLGSGHHPAVYPKLTSLSTVARNAKWFKVDAVAAYR
jgi:hypothetical protein